MSHDEEIRRALEAMAAEAKHDDPMPGIEMRLRKGRRRRGLRLGLVAAAAVAGLLVVLGGAYQVYELLRPEPRLVLTDDQVVSEENEHSAASEGLEVEADEALLTYFGLWSGNITAAPQRPAGLPQAFFVEPPAPLDLGRWDPPRWVFGGEMTPAEVVRAVGEARDEVIVVAQPPAVLLSPQTTDGPNANLVDLRNVRDERGLGETTAATDPGHEDFLVRDSARVWHLYRIPLGAAGEAEARRRLYQAMASLTIGLDGTAAADSIGAWGDLSAWLGSGAQLPGPFPEPEQLRPSAQAGAVVHYRVVSPRSGGPQTEHEVWYQPSTNYYRVELRQDGELRELRSFDGQRMRSWDGRTAEDYSFETYLGSYRALDYDPVAPENVPVPADLRSDLLPENGYMRVGGYLMDGMDLEVFQLPAGDSSGGVSEGATNYPGTWDEPTLERVLVDSRTGLALFWVISEEGRPIVGYADFELLTPGPADLAATFLPEIPESAEIKTDADLVARDPAGVLPAQALDWPADGRSALETLEAIKKEVGEPRPTVYLPRSLPAGFWGSSEWPSGIGYGEPERGTGVAGYNRESPYSGYGIAFSNGAGYILLQTNTPADHGDVRTEKLDVELEGRPFHLIHSMEDTYGTILGVEHSRYEPRLEVLATIGVPREAALEFAASLVRVTD